MTSRAPRGGDWPSFREELLADGETRAAYEQRKPAYDLASHVIALRNRLGLSHADLARAAGVSQRQIADIEAARGTPTWETVARIFRAAGAEVELSISLPDGGRATL